ncbi:Adaptin N terminal region family protein [Trichomonas vaginalis G3]|uniref:AP-3 complex subunit delta n=1 Tax=Trichomonas vaginalis (strain ATCC PRA-98 / G3) TaxID=412133 RepID=A2FGZ9_TRIV3|nr:delta adaptin-related family [Trichomonas vaginalis G3]EAX95812.1 Adaptin N terminal region family protein [Trichomonas vaginalis G3]KAI5500547.1 delta adaptin-related family [Trichomonas vaginalis G3]|eukprot:XP_001308742.1 Adaptin N terminal region family protein [Trichomonas vaginalis G3]
MQKLENLASDLFKPPLYDIAKSYLKAIGDGTQDEKMVEILAKLQDQFKSFRSTPKMDAAQVIIFIGMNGYDTVWSDFNILDVMSIDNYSAKRIAYTAAEFLWTASSEVCLMATNRIARDLTSKDPLVCSCVLSSIPNYLTQPIAMHIANDVVSMMSSSKIYVRQKAITTFYHICCHYPDALKAGFSALKLGLDDVDKGVVYATVTVFHMFCLLFPQQFTQLIPKFFKMLETTNVNWIRLRLIQILTLLNTVEPRTAKKLIPLYSNIMDTVTSPNVIFEVVNSILQMGLADSTLISLATQTIEKYIHSTDENLRFLGLSYFLKLLEIQPKLISQYREVISECLDNDNESMRVKALDLLASLANSKTIDSVVSKIFDNIQLARRTATKNMLIQKLIEICVQNDYALVSDFDWYITVLMDIVSERNISCYKLLGEQFLDLAVRVPTTRTRLAKEMGTILSKISITAADPLLLIASHILGEYSSDPGDFQRVLQPVVSNFGPRVQSSCIQSAFKIYLRCATDESKRKELEQSFALKLPMFEMSFFLDVQDRALCMDSLVKFLASDDGKESLSELSSVLTQPDEDDEEQEKLEIPSDIDLPNPDLDGPEDEESIVKQEETDEKQGKKKKSAGKKGKGKKQAEPTKKGKGKAAKAVKGPEEKSKVQNIGKNGIIKVSATNFTVHDDDNTVIDVELTFENLLDTQIDSVSIEYEDTGFVKGVSLQPTSQIEPNSSIKSTISFHVEKQTAPNVAKVLLIPHCSYSEVLECRIKLFPSLFLSPAPEEKLAAAKENLKKKEVVKLNISAPPREILQATANAIQGNVLPGKDQQSKTVFAEAKNGNVVVALIAIDGEQATLEIESNDGQLVSSLAKEAEMKLKALLK